MASVDTLLGDREIEVMKVTELKAYLRDHGQYVTGKKSELVERAKGVSRLCYPTNASATKLANLPTRPLHNKLITPLGESIPDPQNLTVWIRDTSAIPDFSETEVYNYFFLTMNVKPQHKSFVYFEDRHVHSLEFSPVSDVCSHAIVRCKVIPSLPTSNKKECPDHIAWICLSKVTGKIHSADCTCAAGAGEACNHIAALCHCLVDVTTRRKAGTTSCTSQPCKWNNPRKRKLSPKRSQDVNFRKSSSVLHERKAVIENCSNSEKCDKIGNEKAAYIKPIVNCQRFKQKLESMNFNAAWLKFYADTSTPSNMKPSLPPLHNISFSYCDHVDLHSTDCQQKMQVLFDCMHVSEEDAHCIETLTGGQHKNDLWLAARSERLTSSKFGDVVLMRSDTKPDNLLKDICGYRDISDVTFCKWGTSHEPAARKVYQTANKNCVCVEQCGLIVNPKYPHLGASPDGLIQTDDGHTGGVLEIKCPARCDWKWMEPKECAKDPRFYCSLDENDRVRLKRSHRYYYQIQGQMAITERLWCDFMIWTLNGWTVDRIRFDEKVWNDMLPQLNKFYLTNVIPELFSRRVKRGIPLYN